MNKLNDKDYTDLPLSVELEVLKELDYIDKEEKEADKIESQYERYMFSKWSFEQVINSLHA